MSDQVTQPSTTQKEEYTREDLFSLLACYEGELQARDIVIAALKSEKAKRLLHEARYGQLVGGDPFKALERDSDYMGVSSELDETAVGQMYETQLVQLERLITVQRRCHNRSKQILAAAEKRHARILRQLSEEQQRSAADVAQGDDLCALLENERTRLCQQLEYEQKECNKARQEVLKLEKKLKEEQDRHKSMVMFLINERKQMLFEVHELKIQIDRGSSSTQERMLIAEMQKELNNIRMEKEKLHTALEIAHSEIQSLKENLKKGDEALTVMRNDVHMNTRTYNNNNVRPLHDGSVVMLNKSAPTPLSPSRNTTSGLPPVINDSRHPMRPRLTNSSTFPANDRVPQSRVPLRGPCRVLPVAAGPSPSTRKGQNTTTVRPKTLSTARSINQTSSHECVMSSSSDASEKLKSNYLIGAELEIEQLGAVIESMSTANKRSASLPRNGKNGGIIKQKPRIATPVKPAATNKRSTIFKAFGVTTRNNDKAGS